MSLASRAFTPTSTGVTATTVAADIAKFGGPIIALISALAASGAISVPGSWLGVVDAVIALLTAVKSVKTQQQVAVAKTAAAK